MKYIIQKHTRQVMNNYVVNNNMPCKGIDLQIVHIEQVN